MATVLVVDDDKDGRDFLVACLGKFGIAARSACCGREAMEIMSGETPGVVVLDVMMPEMSGVDVMELMRSREEWKSLPVVMLTAFPHGPHIDRARELGLACLYEKANFRLANLVACIRRLIGDSARPS